MDCDDCGEEVVASGEVIHDGQIFSCACGTEWMVSDYDDDGMALVRVEHEDRLQAKEGQ